MSTFNEDVASAQEAWKDLWYEVAKSAGLLRLIRRVPWLELKSWVKARELLEQHKKGNA